MVLDEDDEPSVNLTAWKCRQCTFENKATFLACEMCNLERPDLKSSHLAPAPLGNATAALDETAAPTLPPARRVPINLGGGWSCDVCTLVNDNTIDSCEACGAPSSSAQNEIQGVATSMQPSTSRQQQQHANSGIKRKDLEITPTIDNNEEDAANENEIYTLDCGCCTTIGQARTALRAATATRPSTLPDLLRRFSCPSGSGRCKLQVTRRDLEALIGASHAAVVDRTFYDAACMYNKSDASYDLTGSDSGHQIAVLCSDVAGAISQLHRAAQAAGGGGAAAADVAPAGRDEAGHKNWRGIKLDLMHGGHKNIQHKKKGYTKASPNWEDESDLDLDFDYDDSDAYASSKMGTSHYPGAQKPKPNDRRGAGYGGGRHDDNAKLEKLQAAAAERQRNSDQGTSRPLNRLRMTLADIIRSEENLSFSQISPLGWLPLGIVGVLQGGPLAPCLRLLLCNDSLMDITARKDVYAEALQLLTALASRQELVPLLLRPADGDVMALFENPVESGVDNNPGRKEENGRGSKRARREEHGGAGGSEEDSSKRAKKHHQSEKGNERGPLPSPGAVNGILQGADRSCWKALQSFRVQCQLFMRSAQELAGEGSEEDVGTVGTVILVQDTCAAVDEAVGAWKAAVAQPHTEHEHVGGREENKAGGYDPKDRDEAGGSGGGGSHGNGPSVAQKQRYVDALQPFGFRMIDLVEGGDYYFRSELKAVPQGKHGLN